MGVKVITPDLQTEPRGSEHPGHAVSGGSLASGLSSHITLPSTQSRAMAGDGGVGNHTPYFSRLLYELTVGREESLALHSWGAENEMLCRTSIFAKLC